MKIGILAIQGDFHLHEKSLNKLNIDSLYIKNSKDLIKCDALIIPGGESTTMSLLIDKYSLFEDILNFSTNKSLFGTCAGSILMSKESNDIKIRNFNCINLSTKRNAWGSQINSFNDDIVFDDSFNINKYDDYYATFIRAPQYYNINDDCTILARYKKEPVLIRNRNHLVSSFHPEISDDLIIYKYFIKMINE